jgi:4-hydroxymandelate oxidase
VKPVNVSDFEALARERMTASAYNYYAGGAEDEVTLAANRDALRRIAIRPRVLTGTGTSRRAWSCWACRCHCPSASRQPFNKLGHPDGESAAARALAFGIHVLQRRRPRRSRMLPRRRPAAVVSALRPRPPKRHARSRRAEAAGCALVLTVDTPRLGRRERDMRGGFTLPDGITVANLERYGTPDNLRWAGSSALPITSTA